jgi:hypothetical protein
MRSVTRLFAGSMAVAVAAMVVMLAAPAARAHTGTRVLVFAVQPTTTQMGTAMTPAVTVDVEDAWGNPVSCTACVTLTYVPGTPIFGTPALPANNVADAVNGVATFSGLTFSDVGFGFELQASAGEVTSAASNSFDIVTQLLHCQPGQPCQSDTVSSQGTSGSAVASQASTSDVLTATGGGFPNLSCTTLGGVVSFTVTDRSKTITMMLAKNLVKQAPNPGAAHFNICWGSPTPFTTKPGTPLVMNNGEFEGLLPDCSASVPSPCITSRHKTNAGVEVITVSAPAGDPHESF